MTATEPSHASDAASLAEQAEWSASEMINLSSLGGVNAELGLMQGNQVNARMLPIHSARHPELVSGYDLWRVPKLGISATPYTLKRVQGDGS